MLAASPGDKAAPSSATSTSAPAAQSAASLRTGATLREAAHETLRRWAKPGDKEADQAARDFLVLYQELLRDDQMPKAQRESLRLKVRGRLVALTQQISKRVAIENRLAKKDGAKPGAGPKPAEILAQWGGGMGPGMGGGMMGGPGMGGGMMPGMGAGMGGGMMGGMGGGGFGPLLGDSGQELVDLIQAVIAPHTWDVNGGPGSIKYWRPGLSIVVRASDEVHGQVGGLVDQLQRAGN
jgi:hypothetical protein